MIKCLLRSLAWRILDQEIKSDYIHRGALQEYTKWMSRDFPIMEDVNTYFKDNPLGMSKNVSRHREEMAKKYGK